MKELRWRNKIQQKLQFSQPKGILAAQSKTNSDHSLQPYKHGKCCGKNYCQLSNSYQLANYGAMGTGYYRYLHSPLLSIVAVVLLTLVHLILYQSYNLALQCLNWIK